MDKIRFYNWLRLLGIFLSIIFLMFLAYLMREVLMPFFVAGLIVYILNPVADYFEGRGLRRSAVVTVLFLTFVAVIAVGGYLSWGSLMREVADLKVSLPNYLLSIKGSLIQTAGLLEKQRDFLPKGFFSGIIEEKFGQNSGIMLSAAPGLIISAVSLIMSSIIVLFTVFFLLKDGKLMRKKLIRSVPNRYFEITLTILDEVNTAVGNYIRGQITDCLIIGVLSTVGLALIGFKYAILVGAIVGLMNMVPYLGPLAGMIVGFMMALIDGNSLPMGMRVLLVLSIVKLIDDALVNPMVVGSSVELHPLVVILCITVGEALLGVLGMLIAVPVFCALKAIFEVLHKGLITYGFWEGHGAEPAGK